MIWVTQAVYKKDYKVHVKFNDNKEGILDFKYHILNDSRTIFQELKDINIFKNFQVNMDTLTWPNGADLAPEFLYDMLKEKTEIPKEIKIVEGKG